MRHDIGSIRDTSQLSADFIGGRLGFRLIIARFCVINNERITQIGTRATAWQCRSVADGAHACSAVWERICAVASDHEAVTGG
jgi:hypothetical protein